MTTTATVSTTGSPAGRGSGPIPGGAVAAVLGPVLLAVTNALVAVLSSRVPVDSAADAVRQAAEHPLLTEVVSAIGRAIGAPVADARLVDLPQELLDLNQESLAHFQAGVCHGSSDASGPSSRQGAVLVTVNRWPGG